MFKSNRILVLICMAFMVRWGSTSPSSRFVSGSEMGGRSWPVMDGVLRRTPHSHEHSASADAQENVEDDTSSDEQILVEDDSDLEDTEVLAEQNAQAEVEESMGELPVEDDVGSEETDEVPQSELPVEDDAGSEETDEVPQSELPVEDDAGSEETDEVAQTIICDPVITCKGQGTCRPDGTCECNQGYRGTNCSSQTPVEDIHTTVEDDPYAVVSDPYAPVDYVPPPPPCDPYVTCSGKGACRANGGCICYEGFTGDNCSIKITVCDPHTHCSGQGFCTKYGGCICKKGFTGNDCSRTVCDPHTTCSGQGSCGANGGCICNKGFKGKDCSKIHKPKGTKKVKIGGTVKADNIVIHPLVLKVATNFLKIKKKFLHHFINLDDGKFNANLGFAIGGGRGGQSAEDEIVIDPRTGQHLYLNPLMLLPGAGLSAAAGGLVGAPLGAIGGFKAGYKGESVLGQDALGGLLAGIFDEEKATGESSDLIDFNSNVFLKITDLGEQEDDEDDKVPEDDDEEDGCDPYATCSGQGACLANGGCKCYQGFTGEDCSIPTQKTYDQYRVGQSAEDQIVVDPRTGQLFLIMAAHKALKAGHKATKGLAPAVFATSFLGGAGAAAIPSAVVGGIAGKVAGELHTKFLGGATAIPTAVVGGIAGKPILEGVTAIPTTVVGGIADVVGDVNDQVRPIPTTVVGGIADVVGDVNDLFRPKQSAEDEIVVDPRTGQLLLIKKGLKVAKKATKKLAPVVLLAGGTAIKSAVVGGIAGKPIPKQSAEDEIVVDPRTGQLLLIKKGLKVAKKATKKLAPVVLLAGGTAIKSAVVGGIADVVGDVNDLVRPIPTTVVGGIADVVGDVNDLFRPKQKNKKEKKEDEPKQKKNKKEKKKDAEHREQQSNAVVIDRNGNAILVNTDVTGSNFEVDARTGQTIPQPVMLAALQVVRAGAHLAPYAAVPVAIVGGTLAAKAILAKKLMKLGKLLPSFKPEINDGTSNEDVLSGILAGSAASGGRGIDIDSGFSFNLGDVEDDDNDDEDDDIPAPNPHIVQAISYPTPVATKSLNKYGVSYDRTGQLHLPAYF